MEGGGRYFVGIHLKEEVKEKLISLQHQLQERELFEGWYHLPSNFHITLLFLGDNISDARIEQIKQKLLSISLPKFSIEFDKLNIFQRNEGEEPFLRTISVNLKGVTELNFKIDEILNENVQIEKKEHHHCTLVSIGKNAKIMKSKEEIIRQVEEINSNFERITIEVTHFQLFQSILREGDAPLQPVVHSFPLSN